ncbi:MAG: hypothetical protein IKO47_05615 [Ruminococcus sp.]|nr:hypothetical protein [Ruminococcus sp.]
MKRLLTFAAAAALSAQCLVSCSVPLKNDSRRKNGLGNSFTANASVTIDKLKAEGKLSHSGGEWDIEFTAPNTLSGVRLSFADGNVEASYKGLSFSVPQSAVPVKAMMTELISAVEENAAKDELTGEEKDDTLRISGTLEAGNYTLIVDGEGNLCGFEMPNNGLTMSFTDMMLTGGTAEPTSAPEEVTVCVTTTSSTAAVTTTTAAA